MLRNEHAERLIPKATEIQTTERIHMALCPSSAGPLMRWDAVHGIQGFKKQNFGNIEEASVFSL